MSTRLAMDGNTLHGARSMRKTGSRDMHRESASSLDAFVKEIKARTLMAQSEDPFFDMSIKPQNDSLCAIILADEDGDAILSTPASSKAFLQDLVACSSRFEKVTQYNNTSQGNQPQHVESNTDESFIRRAVAEELQIRDQVASTPRTSSISNDQDISRAYSTHRPSRASPASSFWPSSTHVKEGEYNFSSLHGPSKASEFKSELLNCIHHSSPDDSSKRSASNHSVQRQAAVSEGNSWRLEADRWREVALSDKKRFSAQISRLQAESVHAKGVAERERLSAERHAKEVHRLKDEVNR
jgi:hypothetical protein